MDTAGFTVTPHKVSVCLLLQLLASPAQLSPALSLSSLRYQNRLSLYLWVLIKSHNDYLEPPLDRLLNHLRRATGSLAPPVVGYLTTSLSSLTKSPDDLFAFIAEIRSILANPNSYSMEDGPCILDPNGSLGVFLRKCVLSFNMLSFEGVCHLLMCIEVYCNADTGCRSLFERKCRFVNNRNTHSEEDTSATNLGNVNALKECKQSISVHESGARGRLISAGSRDGAFLQTGLQVQGYLTRQGYEIDRRCSSYPFSALEFFLRHIKSLSPELHRVHLLSFFNSVYRHDYFTALENLHRFFDYSSASDGFGASSPVKAFNHGRHEFAPLCLALMHFELGHPDEALKVLFEAIHFSQQQNNDHCLAYTLAAMCFLLSETSCLHPAGFLGLSCSPTSSVGLTSFMSVMEQQLVLLKGSLRSSERLGLKGLSASNHLTLAKFHMLHVQRPLAAFGPRTSTKLQTCPVDVCKELRLCDRLISEFGGESLKLIPLHGSLCTSWLEQLENPSASDPYYLLHGSRDDSGGNSFHFRAHTDTIPSSVLHLVASSYLLRATAWGMYGSSTLSRANVLVQATCFSDASRLPDAALAYAKLIQHLMAFRGYREALLALTVAETKFSSLQKSSPILLTKLQLQHERALHRGDLKTARRLCDELGGLASPAMGVDMNIKAEAMLRRARTFLAAKEFKQAASVAHSLICLCYKSNMHVENASALLLLAEVHKKSENPHLGISYALASRSYCQSLNLDLLKAASTLTLSELWLALGKEHATKATSLVHGVLPVIHGHGGLELCARARIVEVKCHLCNEGYSIFENEEVVVKALRQAGKELQLLEYHELAAEAFYLMAIAFHKLGRFEERESAASSFRQHFLLLQHPPYCGVPQLFR